MRGNRSERFLRKLISQFIFLAGSLEDGLNHLDKFVFLFFFFHHCKTFDVLKIKKGALCLRNFSQSNELSGKQEGWELQKEKMNHCLVYLK